MVPIYLYTKHSRTIVTIILVLVLYDCAVGIIIVYTLCLAHIIIGKAKPAQHGAQGEAMRYERPADDTVASQLKQLETLHGDGMLTDGELEHARARVLQPPSVTPSVTPSIAHGTPSIAQGYSSNPLAYSYQLFSSTGDEAGWHSFDPSVSAEISAKVTAAPDGGCLVLSDGRQVRWGYAMAYCEDDTPDDRPAWLTFFIGQPRDRAAEFNETIEAASMATGLVMLDVRRFRVWVVRCDEPATCCSLVREGAVHLIRHLERPRNSTSRLMLLFICCFMLLLHVGMLWLLCIAAIAGGVMLRMIYARQQSWRHVMT